jgi:transketolase
MKHQYSELYEKSYKVRKRFLDIFTNLGYGHLTTGFSEVEILISVMEEIMDYCPDEEDGDKLYLSKGHGAGMLFPIWEDMGLITPDEALNMVKLKSDTSKIKGWCRPGFNFYGGSLGIGLGMAAGQAKGARLNGDRYLTFCLVGDAECYEGSIYEAMVFAGHNKLSNLIALVDRNGLGCSDFTEHMCEMEPFADKWRACGWEVREVDGHSYEELIKAMSDVRERSAKDAPPLAIIAKTIKGKGWEYTYNKPLMHAYMPKGEDIKRAYDELERI